MKPHLIRWRGMWYCGMRITNPEWWSCAQTPAEAYALWVRNWLEPRSGGTAAQP